MTTVRNHFNLRKPEEPFCNVHRLDEQGNLRLKVFRSRKYGPKAETLWIDFKAIVYFDGSLGWRGACFHVADPEETLGILRTLRDERFRSMSDDDLLDKYTAYVVLTDPHSSPPRRIRIIAEGAEVVLGRKRE